jgi:hypothetical protein
MPAEIFQHHRLVPHGEFEMRSQIVYQETLVIGDSHHEQYEQEEKPRNERLLLGATFLLAVFTAGLFVATYCLVRESQKSSERQMRAYIFIEKREIEFIDGVPRINLVMRNEGKTPAHDVVVYGHASIAPCPWNNFPIEKSGKVRRSKEVLGPNGWRDKQQVELTRDSYVANQGDIEASRMAVYAYGEITYRDAFGRDCWTKYRYFWNGDIHKRRKFGMAADSQGNEADHH